MSSYVASTATGERIPSTIASNEAWKRCEGQVVHGKYRLVQCLSGSDRSGVFRTQGGESPIQKAVIKFVPANRTHAEQQLAAWKLASQLSHPNLIRIFDGGRCQLRNVEFLYLVTEYAEEQLSQILPQRPLTAQELRQMLEGILNVLRYLHHKGFAHAHLRPSNVLAIGDQLKLSSDGLLRIAESPDVGKFSVYDAPEIRNSGVSAAADMWSLGMTLIEAWTQRPPAWDGEGKQAPVQPESLPSPFSDIARNCLRIEPERRWGLSQIQAKLASPSPKPLQPEETADSVRPQITRLKWRLAIPAAALLALSGWLIMRSHAPRTSEATIAVSGSQGIRSAPVPAVGESEAVAANHNSPANSSVQGAVSHQVLPNVSQTARNTVQGRVRVRIRVRVDESGNVSEASFDSPGPSKYFARLAIEAARDWKFTPPVVGGAPVSSEWLLRFGFGRTDTQVVPTQTSP
jgi:TonB family protein